MSDSPVIITLITDPARRALAGATLARARDAVAASAQWRWLHDEVACDIAVADGTADGAAEPGATVARLCEALADDPVDVSLVAAAGRRKRVLVADMDSTIVAEETLDALARRAGGAALAARIAALTARAMAGEIDFAQSLRKRMALLADAPAALLDEVRMHTTLNPGARALVGAMQAHGARCVLVSGGADAFAAHAAALAGFDAFEANRLLVADGRLTGAVAEPVLNRDGKANALRRIAAEQGLGPHDALAVGDGANDMAMIQAAGMGVAYHAKPAVAAAAAHAIDHGDLTALLYLQGYSRDEFATA